MAAVYHLQRRDGNYGIVLGSENPNRLHDRGSAIHMYLMREGNHLTRAQVELLSRAASELIGTAVKERARQHQKQPPSSHLLAEGTSGINLPERVRRD